MALRIFLVGLVAGLGCDPPSGGQFTRVMCTAQSWFLSELSEDDQTSPPPAAIAKSEPVSVPMIAIEPGPTYVPIFAADPIAPVAAVDPAAAPILEPAAEVAALPEPEVIQPVIADKGFVAVVNQMVAGYAVRDQTPEPSTTTLLVDQLATPAQPAPWVEMPTTEIKPETEVAAATTTESGDWVGMPPTETAAAPAAVVATPEAPRGERLGSAVRLTTQALQAWMSLLLQ